MTFTSLLSELRKTKKSWPISSISIAASSGPIGFTAKRLVRTISGSGSSSSAGVAVAAATSSVGFWPPSASCVRVMKRSL
ncbi:MAG: hypothetical protein BWY76_03510 [bacterium ADurb.Bin429]|nr:MAG: hypothetical protein BWY76_03510 [bacterium ADurb.Bin429]